MKSGVIGLPGAGKTTVFEALTRSVSDPGHKGENRLGMVEVPDNRVDLLSEMYKPKKTTFARVEYLLPGARESKKEGKADQNVWTPVRDCDAFIHVIRNFTAYGLEAPAPRDDFTALDQELIIADLVVVEKRIERLANDRRRGKKVSQEESTLLAECLKTLEEEIPLRKKPELAAAPALRGFAFLSAKPMLVLFNNNDEDEEIPDVGDLVDRESCMVIRGKLEQEISQMTDEEAAEFLEEFDISESAMDRVIEGTYDLMGLISFFTVGDDEVRAWTIREGIPAMEASGVIHTDLQKGFIRAEVLAYDDLMAAGSHAAARKKGTVRLEGKTYGVRDGDIMNVRFNV
ncbi:MAG: redox-regulated ATPase YchF [Desulfobacterales bacterium]|nr:redox-regulated ATPase YchF [Desulfobacterales bacterium]